MVVVEIVVFVMRFHFPELILGSRAKERYGDQPMDPMRLDNPSVAQVHQMVQLTLAARPPTLQYSPCPGARPAADPPNSTVARHLVDSLVCREDVSPLLRGTVSYLCLFR